ncbi:MAG TPA: aspartate kinase [Methylomirabilota bacterium]|jgi:aspartate kinase|nr:aspartate kinase [Methylomirabilota bacterium]
MALLVQKFGGSSVADAEKIANVARRVAECAPGNQLVVVVSAMGKTTDGLLTLARQISSAPDLREMDMLLSTGEQVTIALLTMALHARGLKARSFTGPQVGMRTDRSHTQARITQIDADRVRRALDAGEIAVVAGFQGLSDQDEITTLGRGGSDLTAVALAAALKADVCEIYTDVDGVYTADPNIVPDARKLARVAYDEMLELASLGAKVLQTRSVEFAKKYGVTVHVRSTFRPDPGTLVTKEEQGMEQAVVTGVTHDRSQAKISILRVPDRPGIAARVFGAIAVKDIVVDMIVQNISQDGHTDMSFTLPRGDSARAVSELSDVAQEIGARGIVHDERVAKVSIVGVGMRSHSGVASTMFAALAREGINIQMISTSEIAVSCVIEDKYAELAVRTLHDAFDVGRGAAR